MDTVREIISTKENDKLRKSLKKGSQGSDPNVPIRPRESDPNMPKDQRHQT